jgi:hypothetical protein
MRNSEVLTASKGASTVGAVFADICGTPREPHIATPSIQLKGDILRWVSNSDFRKIASCRSLVLNNLFKSRL